jgi:hypothetical protein
MTHMIFSNGSSDAYSSLSCAREENVRVDPRSAGYVTLLVYRLSFPHTQDWSDSHVLLNVFQKIQRQLPLSSIVIIDGTDSDFRRAAAAAAIIRVLIDMIKYFRVAFHTYTQRLIIYVLSEILIIETDYQKFWICSYEKKTMKKKINRTVERYTSLGWYVNRDWEQFHHWLQSLFLLFFVFRLAKRWVHYRIS